MSGDADERVAPTRHGATIVVVWIDLHAWRWIQPRARGATLMVAALLGACGGSSSSGKTVGELGNGEFVYSCVNPNDGACDTVGSAVFPACVLIGGQFEMDYILQESDAVDDDDYDLFVYVESANQSFFAGNGRYRADRLGRAAMLAREDEQVIDIIHLDIVEADGIEVKDATGYEVQGRVEVARGQSVYLDVFATTLGCLPLGGGGEVTASSREPLVASAQGGAQVRVTGEQLGQTKVTVGMAGFTAEVDVLVTEGPARRKKPGEDAGDDASDATDATDDGASEESGSSDGAGSEDTGATDDGATESGSGG
jgi:hypothetical protein